jgi:hypothetical protein
MLLDCQHVHGTDALEGDHEVFEFLFEIRRLTFDGLGLFEECLERSAPLAFETLSNPRNPPGEFLLFEL